MYLVAPKSKIGMEIAMQNAAVYISLTNLCDRITLSSQTKENKHIIKRVLPVRCNRQSEFTLLHFTIFQ